MALKYNKNYTLLLNTILVMSEKQQEKLLKQAIELNDHRHKDRIACLIYAEHDAGGIKEKSFILDINTCGAFVETDNDFRMGDKICISFFDPFNNRKIGTTGKIVRKDPHGFGVDFDKNFRLIEHLEKFISELTKSRGMVIKYDNFLNAIGIIV